MNGFLLREDLRLLVVYCIYISSSLFLSDYKSLSHHIYVVQATIDIQVEAVLYDTTNAYYNCTFSNDKCTLSVPLFGTNAAVLTSPGPKLVCDLFLVLLFDSFLQRLHRSIQDSSHCYAIPENISQTILNPTLCLLFRTILRMSSAQSSLTSPGGSHT